jgi:hypothetical protein
MGLRFTGGRATGTDDADIIAPFDEADDQQASCRVIPHDQFAFLGFGMVGIGEGARERIGKNSDRIEKGYAMLAKLGRGFALVPFELHAGLLSC